MKKNVNELREMLINKKMSFLLLDNIMSTNGYYSVFNDGVISYIKQDKNVVYTAMDTNVAEVQIFFEITTDNEPQEIEEIFYLKVIDIQEF